MAELLDLYPEVANGVIRCIGDLHNPEVIGMAQSAGDTQLARDMVKAVVARHFPTGSAECERLFPLGHAYHEPGFFEGNLQMWRALKDAALAARAATKGEHGFWECALWDGMNCVG